jgi:hypothetical protein
MKTLLLFIGTVLRSRIIQRKGLDAIPAIYNLVRYWWTWTPPLPDAAPEFPLRLNTQGGHQTSLLVAMTNPVGQS